MSAAETAAFVAKKRQAVVKAEAAVRKARARLDTALKDYADEVARQQERGDGFFPKTYLVARKEAVLARKFFEARTSALNTARAEASAPTLGLDGDAS
jgi:hypothetical protein